MARPALNTSDRREAGLLATLKRAEWGADFEAKRSALNPVPAVAITPEVGAVLSYLVRAQALADNERVRHDVHLLTGGRLTAAPRRHGPLSALRLVE